MTPAPPLSQYGDRWFRISEKQLYALMQGWTHTNILDKKPILQTVCDQLCAPHTTTPSEQQEWQNASLRDSEKFICQSERDKVLEKWIKLSECIKKHWGERHEASVYQYNKLVKTLDEFTEELLTPTEAHR